MLKKCLFYWRKHMVNCKLCTHKEGQIKQYKEKYFRYIHPNSSKVLRIKMMTCFLHHHAFFHRALKKANGKAFPLDISTLKGLVF